MQKLEILKGASEILVSIGVGSIVGNAIKLTTDPEAGRVKRLAIGFGGFILSSMVSELANRFTNEKIDSAAETVGKLVGAVKVKTDKDGVDIRIDASDLVDVDITVEEDTVDKTFHNAVQAEKQRVANKKPIKKDEAAE